MANENYQVARHTKTVVIADGEALSAEIDCGMYTLIGVIPPATVAGTALTFQAGMVSGTLGELTYESAAVSYPLAASKPISINPLHVWGYQFLKLNTTSNQNAERTFTLIFKEI